MKMKNKQRYRAAALLLAVILMTPAASAEEEIPSLFHNDEAWFKDGVFPLIVRDGVNYVPADVFAMFDYMSVTVPQSDNLLIHNTETDAYVSILFRQQSAMVNGVLLEEIGVFRDSGVYYVEAETVSAAVGISYQYYTAEDGALSMQLYDENVVTEDFAALAESYLPLPPEIEFIEDAQPEEEPAAEAGKLYFLCGSGTEGAEFTARGVLDEYDMNYTMFMNEDDDMETVTGSLYRGITGISVTFPAGQQPDAATWIELLDAMQEKFMPLTRRTMRYTPSTRSDGWDLQLRAAGYIPVRADYTVNGASDTDRLLNEIIAMVESSGSCKIWLEDCWNTVQLVRELSESGYRVCNLGE